MGEWSGKVGEREIKNAKLKTAHHLQRLSLNTLGGSRLVDVSSTNHAWRLKPQLWKQNRPAPVPNSLILRESAAADFALLAAISIARHFIEFRSG